MVRKMVSPCRKSTNLHNKLFYCILLYWILMWIVNVRAIEVDAEVGGNVSIYCPVNPQQKIKYFYFQKPVPKKPDEFVNGFHSERNMSLISKWNNTRLDPQNKTTVHMYNVTMKHAGVYKCHFDDDYTATVHLNVTAKYSKPVVTIMNNTKLGLPVRCKSHGGYPRAEVTWNISGNEEWHVTAENTETDKLTDLESTFSTVLINCSSGERSISCRVRDSASDTFQVCQPPPPQNTTGIIVGSVVAGAVVLLVAILLIVYFKKRGQDRRHRGDGVEGGDARGQTSDAQEMEHLNTPGNGNA